MYDKCISLELSKKLAEAGCELVSRYFYGKIQVEEAEAWYIHDNVDATNLYNVTGVDTDKLCYTYDILHDICCKYAKEFFGETLICTNCTEKKQDISKDYIGQRFVCNICGGDDIVHMYEYHSKEILELMQDGKKQEAELYIWENCLFNPKNKEVK